MSSSGNDNHYIKCPHCACIFFTQTDLDAHLKRYGSNQAQHLDEYKRNHARIEHGYGGDE